MLTPKSKWEMVNLAGELGFIIALPLLFLSQLGKYLDRQWGTEPLFVIAGVFVSMMLSGFWLYRHLKPFIK